MNITVTKHIDDIKIYENSGYVLIEENFSNDEIDVLTSEVEALLERGGVGMVMEDDGKAVRSFNGPHRFSQAMQELARDERLLGLAREILGGEVYVHQYKINMKRALAGERWEWHSDYWFWQEEDGMPEPKALTAVVYLDDVHDLNGPMLIIPNTHTSRLEQDDHTRPYAELTGGENWQITTSSKLKYQLSHDRLRCEMRKHGLVAAKGKRGTTLFFHCNLLHYSSPNPSAWDRRAIFISYNRVDNALVPIESPRPDFLASRDFTPLHVAQRPAPRR
ncbi:phytanoyl-CoA dioxygenase [Xanthomonas translucens pv. poae]|uniref:Phytanoyl-CoA dioxygenase n=1 Tax=Xanthomonas graminis pv. poae TaxID=227946 RepID=A0A0K3A5V4_9XANT|nr:phytanoyl-CoA dioxygenase family protein [Xanthomonas translucens]UKE63134.1 phytanoyl-CoA dioxygenase family protein [Xanthomonas translucens pv. poae]CTP93223.1 phytanoyl-CoA dioxygenase [Xanthomonas translucens pv. poae]